MRGLTDMQNREVGLRTDARIHGCDITCMTCFNLCSTSLARIRINVSQFALIRDLADAHRREGVYQIRWTLCVTAVV